MAQSVHDAVTNKNETLKHHADNLAKSKNRLAVFTEIYRGRGKPKTAKAIAAATNLSQTSVLTSGQQLVDANMATRNEVDEEGRKVIGYGKNDFCRSNRDQILRLVANPVRRSALPTKQNPKAQQGLTQIRISIPKNLSQAEQVTIDDIDSFEAVRGVQTGETQLSGMAESNFKNGIASILGEPAEFKDWGGEKSDLMTTRVRFCGRRIASAFAFKGPGQKGKLTPARMGKNGDQCQRLFSEPADLYFVQHWREIDPSVIELMQTFAIMRSTTLMKPIRFCVIDGKDSARLVMAYPDHFKS